MPQRNCLKTLSSNLKIAQDRYCSLFDLVHQIQNEQSEIVKSFNKIYEEHIIENKLLDNLTFHHILTRDDLDFDVSDKHTKHTFKFISDLSNNKDWKNLVKFWTNERDEVNQVGRKPSDLNVDGCLIHFSSYGKRDIKSLDYKNNICFTFKGSEEAISFFRRHNIKFASNDIDERIEIYKKHIRNMEILKQEFSK